MFEAWNSFLLFETALYASHQPARVEDSVSEGVYRHSEQF
jgi:hypothetical protein